jgi:hypothetical protein
MATNTTVATADLIDLLIRANDTDAARWPEGAKEGAAMLARIREIESECIAQHGEFDWERLSADVQDEYDSNCGQLNVWRSNCWSSWDEVEQRLNGTGGPDMG